MYLRLTHFFMIGKESNLMPSFYYSVYGPYIEQYVDMQISLGYKPRERGSILSSFDKWALERNEEVVCLSKELTDEWGTIRPNESEVNRYKRIQGVRLFASFLCKIGHPSYISPLPKFKTTFTPYIFTSRQVSTFFNVCDHLDMFVPNNAAIFILPVLFRMLYATGLRISEALSLTCNDVNLQDNHLLVRNSKNGLDRAVPVSDTLSEVLAEYLEYRNEYSKLIYNASNRFFIRSDGRDCKIDAVYRWFRKILYRAGISHGGKGIGPRIHDFRHTMACHALAHMSETGLDLYYSLPILSTYLGHQSLSATDGYLRLTAQMYPELTTKINQLSPNLFSDVYNTNDHEAN